MNKTPFEMAVVNYFFEHDYHDRGMLKWQGFYLSDHTAALKEMKKGISNEKWWDMILEKMSPNVGFGVQLRRLTSNA